MERKVPTPPPPYSGLWNVFVPSRKQLVVLIYLSRRDQPPPRVLPDSTEVLCQLRNKSIIHLVKGARGPNKLDTIWLSASPSPHSACSCSTRTPGVPQFLV